MQTLARRSKKPAAIKKNKSGMMIRIAGRLDIPDWVQDHNSFRRWARSDACPEHASVAFLCGTLWVDPDMEQFYVHNQVKAEFTVTLLPLVKADSLGRYGTDGMLISNAEIGLSTIPDGFYFSFDSYRAKRIREVSGSKNGCTEFDGVPEMVLEIVSNSSEKKDLVDLRLMYWRAGVQEYWLVDARTEEVSFDILKLGERGYLEVKRLSGGWVRSDVFNRQFRLAAGRDPIGKPLYSLEAK